MKRQNGSDDTFYIAIATNEKFIKYAYVMLISDILTRVFC